MLISKKLTFLLFAIIMISSATAGLGVYEINTCVDIRTILNSSAVNISSISYPNTTVLYLDDLMTKNGKTFNYTFCDNTITGKYIYDYYDNEGNVYVNDYTITNTGTELNEGQSILYVVLLMVLGLSLYLTISYINKLPDSNMRDEEDGSIIKVSWLKHARKPLWGLSYAIIWAILFTSANLSFAYLPKAMFGELLLTIALFMGYLGAILLILMLLMILHDVLTDQKIQRLLDRGIDSW